MPIERRPARPLAKGPRAESREKPHHVSDGETLATVAQKYGVSVQELLLHNFATLEPAEINWYLREQVGCNLSTDDGNNWRFSRTANPGLLYLPKQPVRPESIAVTKRPGEAVRLDRPGPTTLLLPTKYAHEFELFGDGKEFGYFLVKASVAIEGEVTQQGGLIKTSLKKDAVKVAVESKLSENTSSSFGLQLDKKVLEKIGKAIESGSKEDVLRAMAAPIEGSLKTSTAFRWGKVAIIPEVSAELSKTPAAFSVAGEFEDYLFVENCPFKGKFSVVLTIHVGLSKMGWEALKAKLGPLLRQFLTSSGRAFAAIGEWLVAEGILAGAVFTLVGILGTIGLVSFATWAVHRDRSQLSALVEWYKKAFVARVFREARPAGFSFGDKSLRDAVIELGELDAVIEAQKALARVGDPNAQASSDAVLDAYRRLLIVAAGGKIEHAKWELGRAIDAKAKAIVGL